KWPCKSIHSADAAARGGADRAVGPKILVERVNVVDAGELVGALGKNGKTVAADREIIVQGDAITRSRLDLRAVQRHAIGDDALAIPLAVVPGEGKSLRCLQDARALGVRPLLF